MYFLDMMYFLSSGLVMRGGFEQSATPYPKEVPFRPVQPSRSSYHLGLLGQMSSGLREPSKRVDPLPFCVQWEGRHFQATKKCCGLFKNTLAYTWDILRHIEIIRDNLWLTWHVLWLRQVCEPTSQTDGCFEWAWKRGGICGILDGCFEAQRGDESYR